MCYFTAVFLTSENGDVVAYLEELPGARTGKERRRKARRRVFGRRRRRFWTPAASSLAPASRPHPPCWNGAFFVSWAPSDDDSGADGTEATRLGVFARILCEFCRTRELIQSLGTAVVARPYSLCRNICRSASMVISGSAFCCRNVKPNPSP